MKDIMKMKDKLIKALEGRVFEHGIIPTGEINFYPELLKACEQNICGRYNASWTCPPAIGPMENHKNRILSFSHALIFTTKGDLEDSFDYEGMTKTGEEHRLLTREIHERFGGTNPVFGAGSCRVCEKCAYPEPCREPQKTYLSLEAAGINVSDLSRAGGLRYNNGENTVRYFSIVLFNDTV